LGDGILQAQVREVGEMNTLIQDLQKTPTSSDALDIPPMMVGQ
jgi:hypothetical protein